MAAVLRQRTHENLQLAGLAEGTQKAYHQLITQFAAHFHKPPDQISEQEFREYLLCLKNERRYSSGALKVGAIIIIITHIIPRDWPTFRTLPIPRSWSLSDVLWSWSAATGRTGVAHWLCNCRVVQWDAVLYEPI